MLTKVGTTGYLLQHPYTFLNAYTEQNVWNPLINILSTMFIFHIKPWLSVSLLLLNITLIYSEMIENFFVIDML